MVEEAQRQRTTFPDAREQFIADQGYQRTVVDPIVRRQQNLVKSYEGTGIVPQTFPDWVINSPDASGMINEWGRYGSGSLFGSPMWMDAKNKVNKNFGLAGTEVAQSKWRGKGFQAIIDMIMNRENLNERGARKFVFDNYGLAV